MDPIALPEVTLGKDDQWMFFRDLLGMESSQEKSKSAAIFLFSIFYLSISKSVSGLNEGNFLFHT